MAGKVTIGATLTLETAKSLENVGKVRQALREAQKAVIEAQQEFGPLSEEALKAAQYVADLKDQLQEAAEVADMFDPGKKFQTITNAAAAVASGFSAVQGAMALIGAESEEVEKALLRVQAAMALSQGLSTIADSVKHFQRLGAMIKSTTIFQQANNAATAAAAAIQRAFGVAVNQTTASFTALKGAIVATGIGALVVGLGVVIDKVMEWTSATNDAADAQEKLNEQIEKANRHLQIAEQVYAREERLEIARAKLAGKSEREIFEIQQKYRRLRTQAHIDQYRELQKVDEVEAFKTLQRIKDLNAEGQAAQMEFEAQERERRKAAWEKRRKEELEELKKDAKNRADIERLRILNGINSVQIQMPAKTAEELQYERDVAARAENRKDLEKYLQYTQESYAKFTEIHARNVAERMANERAEYEAKQSLANSAVSFLGNLSQLVGEQTKLGKVLALSEIAAGTATGFIQALDIAQKAAKATGPAAALAFPVFYASQIAAVIGAAARAKAVLKGGDTGSFSTTTPQVSQVAPIAPQVTNNVTALDRDTINQIGNQALRAYVVESDVTDTQERIERIRRAARIN